MKWLFSVVFGILFGVFSYVGLHLFGSKFLREPMSFIYILVVGIVLNYLMNLIESWYNRTKNH